MLIYDPHPPLTAPDRLQTDVRHSPRRGVSAKLTSGLVWTICPKVPPGDAGHPVCLDTSTEIRLRLLVIVGIILKHSPYCSLALSTSDMLHVRSSNISCVLQSAESMLPSLQASTSIAAHSRYSVEVMLKIRW